MILGSGDPIKRISSSRRYFRFGPRICTQEEDMKFAGELRIAGVSEMLPGRIGMLLA